ncbi:hypothetical protein LPC08_19910 [Roseomonas sp. OT10]|uniref:hypothetical protein n=1 Tax=Roseomonas cutis TaxID=2897332 RepID=UPI001E647D51|nr:hypothetical protein [Roseomonas sp. OT10]UFN48256.1 hypothetical protein LPC08_19910 [Roseomonas sp. OT10]
MSDHRASHRNADPFAADRQPVLDMTPDGEFRTPAPPGLLDRVLARIGGVAALVVLVVGGLVVAALGMLMLGLLLPVLLVAGLVASGVFWWRLRQARRSGRPMAFMVMRR